MKTHGNRPTAEFLDGAQRKPSRRPERSVTQDAPKPPHIDLRIVRLASVDTDFDWGVEDWERFIAKLGRDNRALGRAVSLGSIGLTYVPAENMNYMLKEVWPRDFHNPGRKMRLFRRVAEAANQLIRENSRYAFEQRLAEVESSRNQPINQAWTDPEIDEIFDEIGMSRPKDEAQDNGLTLEEQLRLAEHAFGPLTMAVRGLDLYGRAAYGADMSNNEEVYDEFYSFEGMLRRNSGLDTSSIKRDFRPHSTLFELHGYISDAQPTYKPEEIPSHMVMLPPKVESYNL